MLCQGEQGQHRTFCSLPLRPIKICRHLSCWPGWLANWNRIGIFSSVFWALSGRKFCDQNTQVHGPSGYIHKHPLLHCCTLNRTLRRNGPRGAISVLVYSAKEKVNGRHLQGAQWTETPSVSSSCLCSSCLSHCLPPQQAFFLPPWKKIVLKDQGPVENPQDS